MSVVSSLYTGASGLSSHGKAISVLGDNVANANTVGYKRSRANFADVLGRSTGPEPDASIGQGSRVASVQKMMTQGALLGTGSSTDLAIKGNGFFCVKGSASGITGNFYSRAGQFHLDKDGQLVNEAGLTAQGYLADATGTLTKKVTDIKIPQSQMAPQATSKATIAGNLSAAATAFTTGSFSATNAAATSNYSTQVTVYDSLGKAHTMTIYFRKTSATAWSYHGVVDGGEITGGSAGTPTVTMTGTLTFDTSGKLASVNAGTSTVNFANAVQGQTITMDWGDATGATPAGTGLKGMTSYASASTTSYASQDGNSSGNLAGISVGADGKISGVFSNGKKKTVGQVLLADFKSAQDLNRIGGNLYAETLDSGQALMREAAAGGMGTISAGTLEQSNVDLAKEFVNLIAFQRGFQANSRTVTTADQMLQELLALKR